MNGIGVEGCAVKNIYTIPKIEDAIGHQRVVSRQLVPLTSGSDAGSDRLCGKLSSQGSQPNLTLIHSFIDVVDFGCYTYVMEQKLLHDDLA